jgi:hypothetical protein
MKKAIAGLVIATVALLPSVGSAQTGHPYYPMNAGTQIVYQVYEIQGHWDEATMQLSVTSRTPWNRPIAIQYSSTTCPAYFGNGPLYRATYVDSGTAGGALIDGGGVSPGGISYIGEAINEIGWVHVPFIAKLAVNPSAGQTIDATSTVTRGCSDTTFQQTLRWRNRTIAHASSWGPFQDVWRTGLHEYGSESGGVDRVYNYVFARGKGMVNFWYGQLGPDGTITNGQEFYAIQY